MKFGKQTSRALKDFFLALSLSNLCMVDPWTRVLGLSLNDGFFRQAPPTRMDIVGVVIAVLFLTATFWAVATLIRASRSMVLKTAVRTLFLLTALIPFHMLLLRIPTFWWLETRLCLWYSEVSGYAPETAHLTLTLGAIAAGAATVRWGRQLEKVIIPIVMIEVPFVLITFFQAGNFFSNYLKFAPQYQDQAAIAMKNIVRTGTHSRVVWLLFDELDRGVIDGSDRFGASYPEIARLQRQSVVATNAVSPTSCTRLSLPTYLSGREISVLDPQSPSSANITLASTGQTIRWDPQDNLFAQAMSEGFTTGIVGWYIPYCRILKNSFNYCWWAPAYSNSIRTGATIPDDILTQLWNAADATPVGAIALKKIDKNALCTHRIHVYEDSLTRAEQLATNPRFDLVFVHFSIPHPPGFYRADTHQFDCSGDYVDNVSLVDRTIGELRVAMEAAHTWNNSTVIVSSDHPYRPWLWGKISQRNRGGNSADDER
jgi:Sulfatase